MRVKICQNYRRGDRPDSNLNNFVVGQNEGQKYRPRDRPISNLNKIVRETVLVQI